jgi:plastocyanin
VNSVTKRGKRYLRRKPRTTENLRSLISGTSSAHFWHPDWHALRNPWLHTQREITAKKYEFDVPRIEMKVGETIELTLNSLDAKHGFECKELGVSNVTKPGTYAFKCANFCGMGHGKMKGEIVVSL